MSVYQIKDKNKWSGDGRSWYYRTYYTDMYGYRKQKNSKLYLTKSEAKNAEREFLNKIVTNDEVNYDITFKEVYEEWWYLKKRKLKSSTAYNTEKILNKNILEFFKTFKLHSIKVNIIYMWYEYLEKTNITIKYQNSIIGYLREILLYAHNNYEFDNKIVSKIEKITLNTVETKIKETEWNYWTFDEYKKFIGTVDNPFWFLIFNFLYYTGLRIGECLALQWKDIDLNKGKVNIYKTYTNKLGNGKYDLIPPKTDNSYRIIDIDTDLLNLLKERLKTAKKIINFSDEMFIFGDIVPVSKTTVDRHFSKYKSMIDIKHITLHGFRHSHVSLLIHLGCDSRDVAERIGDTKEVVEKTYYHMFPEKKSQTIMALNNFKIRCNQDVNQ